MPACPPGRAVRTGMTQSGRLLRTEPATAGELAEGNSPPFFSSKPLAFILISLFRLLITA